MIRTSEELQAALDQWRRLYAAATTPDDVVYCREIAAALGKLVNISEDRREEHIESALLAMRDETDAAAYKVLMWACGKADNL